MHGSELYADIDSKQYQRNLLREAIFSGSSGSWGQWMSALTVGSTGIGSTMHGHNDLQQHVDSSAVYGQYVNSSLSPITVTVTHP